MKPNAPIIYKRFLQKIETSTTQQVRTIAEIQNEICILDVTLSPMATWSTLSEYNTFIIIPLAGEITFQATTLTIPVNIGELYEYYLIAKAPISITNPYPTATVNCIILQFNAVPNTPKLQDLEFPYFHYQHPKIHLALRQFTNREEFEYIPQKPNQSLWVICLAGAFEFENRLLEDRDGLLHPPANRYEMEGLIEGALLLFLQFIDPIHR